MHGRAVPLRPGLDRATMGIQSLELRQQRWVNIDHAAAPAPHESRRQQPHEAGEADEIGPVRVKLAIERALEGLAVLAKPPMIDDGGLDARLTCKAEAGRVGAVGYDEHDRCRIISRLGCLDQRRHVRAAAGNQHGHPLFAGVLSPPAVRPCLHPAMRLPASSAVLGAERNRAPPRSAETPPVQVIGPDYIIGARRRVADPALLDCACFAEFGLTGAAGIGRVSSRGVA